MTSRAFGIHSYSCMNYWAEGIAFLGWSFSLLLQQRKRDKTDFV